MIDNNLMNSILEKCLDNYSSTGIPKTELIFGFDNNFRTNYLDTLDYMFESNLIYPNYTAIGMAQVQLTKLGIEVANQIL